jgi:glutamate/tyrosine decarboxylase-like PLP-dependent enzyme
MSCIFGLQLTVAMFTQAAQQFAEGVKQIDGLEMVGKPDMCLVAIKSTSKTLNIYKVNDLMSQRGWHLKALHVVHLVLMRSCWESHLELLTAGPERLCAGSDGGP